MLTRAGPEIGVASTKAFTTQLTALGMLVIALATPPRCRRRARARPRRAPHRAAGAGREAPSRSIRSSSSSRSALPTSATRCSSAAARSIRSPWRGRSSSRRSPTSTPRATRRASSSTGHSRWSTPTCRWSPSRPTTTCSRSSSRISWKCVRAAVSCIVFADPESGIAASDGVTVIEMPRHVTYVQAPVVYSRTAATARLSRGDPQGHRRRSAAQSRQERHRRVADADRSLRCRPCVAAQRAPAASGAGARLR